MTKILALAVVVWLVIGAIAAGQRGYYGNGRKTDCAKFGDTAITILAGPLNYFGVNPKVTCHVPQPSR
jgi:hypothetical protein